MIHFLSRNKVLVIVGLGIISSLSVYLISGSKKEENLPSVMVTKVMEGSISDSLTFTGILKAYDDVAISATTNGRIVSMNVDVGDRVTAGELLMRLDGVTDKATIGSLGDSILAVGETTQALENLYGERIKSAEENLSLVKTTGDTASSTENVKAVSLITGTAIVSTQVSDTLGELLAMRNGIKKYKDVAHYNALGATNFATRSSAEDSLQKYQIAQNEYQIFFDTNILNKQPSNEIIGKGLILSLGLMESAKKALSDSYTMLRYSVVNDSLSEMQLQSYKTTVTSLGSSVEENMGNIRNVRSEIVQTELGLSTLKKEKASKISEINAQATELRGRLSVAEAALSNSSVYAPFDGVISEKMVSVGSVAGFGVPVYRLLNDEVLKVTISVPDDQVDLFSVGEEITLSTSYGENATSTITKIYPSVDVTNAKTTVEIKVDNHDHVLKAGSIARVILPVKHSPNTVLLPRDALISLYGLSYVFTVEGNVVTRKIVEVGVQNDSTVAIISGISAGDVVVSGGGRYLRSGDKVTVVDGKYDTQ